MKPNKRRNKPLDRKLNSPEDIHNSSRHAKGKISDEFQESLQEDMRGPMEGMEEVIAKK